MAKCCANCGQTGHYKATCPLPHRPDLVEIIKQRNRDNARARYDRLKRERGPDFERDRQHRQQAAIRQREVRKALRTSEQGREEWRAERRVAKWWMSILHRIKTSSKARGLKRELGAAWIKAQFRRQQGKCYYTGIPFEIVQDKRGLRRPSIDRIDSRLGYTSDNSVLCLTAINYLKNDYSVDDVIKLLLDIVDLHR